MTTLNGRMRDQQARDERALCGVQAHADLLKERDQLRAVLGDLLAERELAARFDAVREVLVWLDRRPVYAHYEVAVRERALAVKRLMFAVGGVPASATSDMLTARLLHALKDCWAEMAGRPKSCGHSFHCTCVGEQAVGAIADAETQLERRALTAPRIDPPTPEAKP